MRWLEPHRGRLVTLAVLSLLAAGVQMIEPLFLRHIVDKVLLVPGLQGSERLWKLNVAGGAFLTLVIVSALVGVVKDYTQKSLNFRVVLSLRKALFDRLLHLPLPRLWDMKTGGILSRLAPSADGAVGDSWRDAHELCFCTTGASELSRGASRCGADRRSCRRSVFRDPCCAKSCSHGTPSCSWDRCGTSSAGARQHRIRSARRNRIRSHGRGAPRERARVHRQARRRL